jgi:hypothetical protein
VFIAHIHRLREFADHEKILREIFFPSRRGKLEQMFRSSFALHCERSFVLAAPLTCFFLSRALIFCEQQIKKRRRKDEKLVISLHELKFHRCNVLRMIHDFSHFSRPHTSHIKRDRDFKFTNKHQPV